MKRILVVRTDRVGDVVYITPALRELRRSFPDAFIATLTQPHTRNILLNNPHLNATLTDDLKKESYWEVLKKIRSYKFTHALLMLPTERAAYQLFLAGIPVRVGVGHKLYEVITFMRSVSRKNYIPLRHESDYCMDLARKIGARPLEKHLEMFVTEAEKKDADALLLSKGIFPGDTKIFFHSGSLGSAPNWTEDKYLAFCEMLLKTIPEENLKVVLTAREMSPGFLHAMLALDRKRVIHLAPMLDDLRVFISAISRANVFFGPSTGPLHIADALNIPCVGLHCHRPMNCPTHQGILNSKSVNLEVSAAYCDSHCSSDHKQCAFEDGISITEAIDAVRSVITAGGSF